jgi:hypothetical protein
LEEQQEQHQHGKMIDSQRNISLEEILSVVSEEEIFKYYTGLSPNEQHRSPLRDYILINGVKNTDFTPSFIYGNKYGKWRFRDFGLGIGGDCVEYVKIKFSLNYPSALNKIADDFNIIQTNTITTAPVQESTIKDTKIEVRIISWNKHNLKYWYDYGISKQTLQYYNVHPISHYWINGRRFVTESSYCYLLDNNVIKILNLNNKKFKWVGNFKSGTFEGYSQIPEKNELLIITKSLKDVMVLYELGYVSIAPTTETYQIPPSFLSRLQTKFRNIIFFYDNDIAGLREMDKYKDYPYIFIPFNVKDISDYSKNRGILEAQELMKWLLHKT